ncbi:MAG: hypothetical protein JWO28_1644, partial [Hyphomicrobiales bacterium]|nr:hypothetical protein [Hyphomicrobiales bacterium]
MTALRDILPSAKIADDIGAAQVA